MYQYQQSISILNSEVAKYGKRKIRELLKRCGYSMAEIFALAPVKIRGEK